MNPADVGTLYLRSPEFSPYEAVESAKIVTATFGGDFKGIYKARRNVRYRAGDPRKLWEPSSDNE
jgi:hypothetical protein